MSHIHLAVRSGWIRLDIESSKSQNDPSEDETVMNGSLEISICISNVKMSQNLPAQNGNFPSPPPSAFHIWTNTSPKPRQIPADPTWKAGPLAYPGHPGDFLWSQSSDGPFHQALGFHVDRRIPIPMIFQRPYVSRQIAWELDRSCQLCNVVGVASEINKARFISGIHRHRQTDTHTQRVSVCLYQCTRKMQCRYAS